MGKKQPEGPPPAPPVQRLRIRYAKRGRLRFSSHRDFARAFERSLRRANVPMAYSAGFHPHPKISYVGAAPTGVGSEAEYLEIALTELCDPEAVRLMIDEVMPDGLDMVLAMDALHCPPGNFADQMQASVWLLEFADGTDALSAAVTQFLAVETAMVQRLTKDGHRDLEARTPVISARIVDPKTVAAVVQRAVIAPDASARAKRAILELVVRQVTPSVRPDDVLAALHSVAGFAPSQPPRVTRVAQGPLEESGLVLDPFGDAGQSPREPVVPALAVSDS